MGKKNSKRMILRDKPNVKKRKNKAKKKTIRHKLEDKQAPRTSPIALARTVLEIKSLELLGGFGSSVTVHVLAQHTGCLAWRHRILGAMAEEGLESLHSTIKGDIENVARGDLVERAQVAIQRWGVQIQLADLGKNVD
uniref:Uncharacterized protein n=1 Tax=Acrobeloides nanus TaxID=290746 RepID=A0A914DHF6_9BILA